MLKNAIIIIVVSVVAMFFQSQLGAVLRYLLTIHDKIADALAIVFSNAPAGRMIQETIALILIPILIGTIAALIWLMIKRNEMPHLTTSIWVIWTILLVMVLLHPQLTTPQMTQQKTAQIQNTERTVYY